MFEKLLRKNTDGEAYEKKIETEVDAQSICLIASTIHKGKGVTTFVDEIACALLIEGFLVNIVTLTRKPNRKMIISASNPQNLNIFYLPEQLFQFLSFLFRSKIDLIISNLYYSIFLSFFKSQQKIHAMHGFGKLESGIVKFLIGNLSNIIGYKLADKVMSPSYLTSSVNRVFGVHKSFVTPWGIPRIFESLSNLEIISYHRRDIDVLYVGRIVPEKNVALLVEVFQRLLQHSPNINLHIVGSLHSQKVLNLQKLPQSVVCHGHLDQVELKDIYSRSKLFVSLNPDEPFGFTYLEALSCGTAVVIPKGCGIAPFIQEHMGLAVDLDVKSLEESIIYGLHKNWDSEAIARQSREIFDWEKTISVIMEP